jgi:hypothetical protein
VTASPTDAIIAEIEARYERAYLQQPSLHPPFSAQFLAFVRDNVERELVTLSTITDWCSADGTPREPIQMENVAPGRRAS